MRSARLILIVLAVAGCIGGPPTVFSPPPALSFSPAAASATGHTPMWCGAAPIGPAPPSGSTPGPAYTPNPNNTLVCMYTVNRSSVDMAMVDSNSWELIAACSSSTGSSSVPAASWGFEIYRAVAGSVTGPVLGAFGSGQVSGEPPYLLEVDIGPDQGVSISQQGSLPDAGGTPPASCSPAPGT